MSAGEHLFSFTWTVALAGLAVAPVPDVVATESLSVGGPRKSLFRHAEPFTESAMTRRARQGSGVAQAPGGGMGSGQVRHLIALRGAQRKNDFGKGVRLRKERLLGAPARQVFRGDNDLNRPHREPRQCHGPSEGEEILTRAHVKYECE